MYISYMYIFVYVYMYICMYVCMYVCIYIYSHTSHPQSTVASLSHLREIGKWHERAAQHAHVSAGAGKKKDCSNPHAKETLTRC